MRGLAFFRIVLLLIGKDLVGFGTTTPAVPGESKANDNPTIVATNTEVKANFAIFQSGFSEILHAAEM